MLFKSPDINEIVTAGIALSNNESVIIMLPNETLPVFVTVKV